MIFMIKRIYEVTFVAVKNKSATRGTQNMYPSEFQQTVCITWSQIKYMYKYYQGDRIRHCIHSDMTKVYIDFGQSKLKEPFLSLQAKYSETV